MRKIILPFFILGILFVALVIWTKGIKCRGIKCLSGENLNEFTLAETYQDDQTAFRGLYRGEETVLRLETYYNVPKGQVDERIASTITRLKGLYERAPAPYPGEISDEIRCDSSLAPKIYDQTNDFPLYVEIYLNDRLSYGVCNSEQATHKGILTFLTCPKRQIFTQLEFISSQINYRNNEEEIKSVIRSLSCKD